MRRILAIAALALGGSLAAGPAAGKKADGASAEAKQRFAAGMARYNIEQYDEAIKEFQAAYLLVPDPIFLYNIAQSYRLSGRSGKAIDYYKRYLRGTPPPPNRADVEGIVRDLEEKERAAAAAAAKASTPPPPAPAPPPLKLPPTTPFVEKETQTAYLNYLVEDNKLYTLVGLGLRKVYGFKVYGMALYLEDVPARTAMVKLASVAGGRDVAHLTADDLAQNFILLGDFGKIGVLKFVRSVAAKDVQEAYRESLEEELKNAAPEVKKNIPAFVKLFGKDMKEGDECVIRSTAAGAISVDLGGARQTGPTDLHLAQAIWNIWLGKRPISPDLRKALVGRIDALAR